jgi:hypothetical protein
MQEVDQPVDDTVLVQAFGQPLQMDKLVRPAK